MTPDSKPKQEKPKTRDEGVFGSSPRSTRYITLITIFASIINFFDGWASSVMAYALPVDPGVQAGVTIYDYFSFTMFDFNVALIFIVGGLGVMSAIVFKWAADKYGRKPLYLITACGFTFFTILTAFVPPGSWFFPLFLFIRFFANLFLAADLVIVIITEEAPSRHRGRLIAISASMYFMGAFTVTLISFLDIQILWLTTWQSMFFLNIVGFAFIFPIFAFMKETKRFTAMKKYNKWKREKEKEKKRKQLEDKKVEKKKLLERSWLTPFQKRHLRALLVAVVPGIGATIIVTAALSYLPLMLSNELYIANWELYIIPYIISGFVGILIAQYLMDKWERKDIVIRGGSLMCVSGAFIGSSAIFIHPPLPFLGNWTAFIAVNPGFANFLLVIQPITISILILGFCMGAIGGTMTLAAIALIPLEMTPTHILSTATGWWGFLTRIATILSPTIIYWGAMMVAGTSGVGTGGMTFGYTYFSIGIFLITMLFAIIYLAPERGTSRGKSIEEIIFTQNKLGLKRECSRKREYTILILCYVIFFSHTFIYGIILSVSYYGFNTIIPNLQLLLTEGLINIGMMVVVVYIREKVIGVGPFTKKKKKKAGSKKEVSKPAEIQV